jgi:hypothetical protein
VSASAEVFITITADKEKSPHRYPEIVEKWLLEVGFPTSGERYSKSSLQSGDIYEVRSHSVSYDVFGQEWCASLVKELRFLDKELDVEVYVYNLDREADASYTTADIIDQETKTCDECSSRITDWYVADNNGLKVERVYCPKCEEIRSDKYGCAMILAQGASCQNGACGCGGTGSYDKEEAV